MNALIVAALYKFKSKRPFEDYIQYLNDLVSNVDSNIVLFTSPDLVEIIPKFSNLKVISLNMDDWKSNELMSNKEYDEYVEEYGIRYMKKETPDPKLFKIYLEKHVFVTRATELFPNYKFYVWMDAGCIRDKEWFPYLKSFPSVSKIESINIGDKICFQNRFHIANYKTYELDNFGFISGSIILGNKFAWRKFRILFLDCFYEMRRNKKLIVQDELIYCNMFSKFPNDVMMVETFHPNICPEILNRYRTDWFGAIGLFSDKYIDTIRVTHKNPIRITLASWGVEEFRLDVTSQVQDLVDKTPITIDNSMFFDTGAWRKKFLFIHYENGMIQRVDQDSIWHLCF